MDLAVLLGATLLVLITASAITAMLRLPSAIDAAVTVGVLASAEIAVVIALPGAMGHLDRTVVLALTAACTVVAVTVARWRRTTIPWRWPARLPDVRRHPWAAGLVLLAGAGLAWQGVAALVLPVYAYDGLTYHGVALARWLQRGDLTVDPALNTCCATHAYNADLESAWWMVLHGSDAFVDLVQLPFAVLGGLAVAGLARSAGAGRAASSAAGALFLTTPVVLAQSSTTYVDVIVVAWALAGLHALVRFAATRSLRHAAIVGVAAGLLAGTKGTGLLWAGALGAALAAVAMWSTRRRWVTVRHAIASMGIVTVAVVALGSFWYARNWIEHGNPLHPFRVEVAGREVFDGPRELSDDILTPPDGGANESAVRSVLRSWTADIDPRDPAPYDYQERTGGLGAAWVWLGLPMLVLGSVLLARQRNAALAAIVVVVLAFSVQPYQWWARFALQLPAVGALAIAVVDHRLARRLARVALRAAALALAAVNVALTSYAVDPAGRAEPLRATDVVALVGDRPDARSLGDLFFPEYRFLDDVPEDATIVVDVEAEAVRFVYPLYGPSWTRRVVAAATEPELGPGTWVVTARGRPLDGELQRDERFALVADVDDLRAWHRP